MRNVHPNTINASWGFQQLTIDKDFNLIPSVFCRKTFPCYSLHVGIGPKYFTTIAGEKGEVEGGK
jgi:hypothetical protein